MTYQATSMTNADVGAALTGDQAFTMFFVYRSDTTVYPTLACLYDEAGSSPGAGWDADNHHYFQGNVGTARTPDQYNTDYLGVDMDTSAPASNWHIGVVRYNPGAASYLDLIPGYDGFDATGTGYTYWSTTTNSVSITVDTLLVGAVGTGGSNFMAPGWISDIVVFDSSLSTANVNAIGEYFANAYTLTWAGSEVPNDPVSLGAIAWWKASDLSPGLSEGDPVPTWTDSINSYVLTSIDTYDPTYRASKAGLEAVEFGYDYVPPPAGPFWEFMVQGVPDGGTTGQVLVKTSNSDYVVDWDTMDHSEIANIGTDDHHAQAHAAEHLSDGTDPLTPEGAVVFRSFTGTSGNIWKMNTTPPIPYTLDEITDRVLTDTGSYGSYFFGSLVHANDNAASFCYDPQGWIEQNEVVDLDEFGATFPAGSGIIWNLPEGDYIIQFSPVIILNSGVKVDSSWYVYVDFPEAYWTRSDWMNGWPHLPIHDVSERYADTQVNPQRIDHVHYVSIRTDDHQPIRVLLYLYVAADMVAAGDYFGSLQLNIQKVA